MTIVRILSAKNLESIDLNNLGNHFTVEGNEHHIVMTLESMSLEDHSGKEVFYVYVECDEINEEATRISNENYPEEKEVVTKLNSPIYIQEIFDEFFNVVAENLEGNTGSRVQEWVTKL